MLHGCHRGASPPVSFCRGKDPCRFSQGRLHGKTREGIEPVAVAAESTLKSRIAHACNVRRERKGERNDESPHGAADAARQGRRGRGDRSVLVHQRGGHDDRHDRRRHHVGNRGQYGDQPTRRGGPQASSWSSSSAAAAAAWRQVVLVLVVLVEPSRMKATGRSVDRPVSFQPALRRDGRLRIEARSNAPALAA